MVTATDFSYAQEAGKLAASVSDDNGNMAEQEPELVLAKAQVYATLALADKLDDVHSMLDTIAAKIGALAAPPGW